jgi:hypothetical protein
MQNISTLHISVLRLRVHTHALKLLRQGTICIDSCLRGGGRRVSLIFSSFLIFFLFFSFFLFLLFLLISVYIISLRRRARGICCTVGGEVRRGALKRGLIRSNWNSETGNVRTVGRGLSSRSLSRSLH